MARIFNNKTWKEFFDKFSTYKGSVSSFCRENNITKSQFYYYKKRFSEPVTATFHAIELNNEETITEVARNHTKGLTDIRIEIGKARIHIPIDETAILSNLIKELVKSC